MNRKQRRAAAKQGGIRPDGPFVAAGLSAAELGELQTSGLAHHQAGRLAQAEACYRKILAAAPRDVNALHLLGVLARQTGQHGAAVELISKAVALNDRVPELQSNLGNAMMDLGRTAEAEASYRRALALKPDYAAAHNNLGNGCKAGASTRRRRPAIGGRWRSSRATPRRTTISASRCWSRPNRPRPRPVAGARSPSSPIMPPPTAISAMRC
jgi:Flp pilus assembly protein TadD